MTHEAAHQDHHHDRFGSIPVLIRMSWPLTIQSNTDNYPNTNKYHRKANTIPGMKLKKRPFFCDVALVHLYRQIIHEHRRAQTLYVCVESVCVVCVSRAP